ncbi:MAG: pantoate--beta-alanine ligase [Pseudomonadota bacterium]
MQIIEDMQTLRAALKSSPGVALVPTMGNLHEGHLALIGRARQEGRPVAASIFVNRLQFGPREDFNTYPRTLQRDCDMLKKAGCDLVFAPGEAAFYPAPQTFRVEPDPALADLLEGEFRPGFFGGVCTVVMKLFCALQPAAAVFGKKDYQQLRIVQRMVEQFALPIEIIAHDTIRAPDGLALSSRNGYLNAAERDEASRLHRTLLWMAGRLAAGETLDAVEREGAAQLRAHGWQPDYLTLRRRTDLSRTFARGEPLVALGAARLGSTRLIDSVEV